MTIIAQQDATIYSFIIFLQTALHVSSDALISAVVEESSTPPLQRKVANTVRTVPDAVITV